MLEVSICENFHYLLQNNVVNKINSEMELQEQIKIVKELLEATKELKLGSLMNYSNIKDLS